MKKHNMEYVKLKYLENDIEFLDPIYISSHHSHNLKCLICNNLWTSCFNRLQKGKKCTNCILTKQTLERKHTLNYVTNKYLDKNIKFCDNNYQTNQTKHNLKCFICNFEWKARFNSFISHNNGCPQCGKNKTAEKLRPKYNSIIEKYAEKNIIFLDTTYKNASFKHNVQCEKCNYIWQSRYNNFSKKEGRGCPKCSGKMKFTLEYIRSVYIKNNIEFIDDFYINHKTKHNLKCLICNHTWQSKFAYIKNENCGCPKCSLLKNEKFTFNYLFNKIGVNNFEHNFKIQTPDLEQNKIFVDFKILFNNYLIYIEYNGDQHYKPVTFGNISQTEAQKNFKKQIKRDEWLREHCKQKNITLIEIDGRKYKENRIIEYMEKQFNILSD